MSKNNMYNLILRKDKLSRSSRPNPFSSMQPFCFRVEGLTFVWGKIQAASGVFRQNFSTFIAFFKFHGFRMAQQQK